MNVAAWVAELKRRHVIRVGIAYIVAAWVVVQVSATVAPEFSLPQWTTRFVLVAVALGFPIALVLSWLFDVRPAGDAPATPESPPVTTAPPPDRRRLAILPFSSFSSGSGAEYFADGITEELTSVVSRISGLEVIARTSVMGYKTEPKPVSVIARELRVGSVLEGSIRRAGDRVRVTVQLIDTATEAHLWSEDFDRELSDVFAIQGGIARAVADILQVRLLSGEERRIDRAPTGDLEAHDLNLLGRHHLLQRNEASLRRAIELFTAALDRDPDFALASAGLAEAWMWTGVGYVRDAPPEALARARAAAEDAVRLDANLAEAQVALGLVAIMQVDLDAAWPALQRAVALNPSSAPAYQALAGYWIMKAEYDEQLRCIERAVELDPRSANIRLEAGWPHLYEGRYEAFLQRCREALALDPTYALAYFNLGEAHEFLGDLEDALTAYERALELGGLWGHTKGYMVRALVKSGDPETARAVLAELRERSERESGLCIPVAIAFDALGDPESAVAWVERGYAEGEPSARWLHLSGFLRFENTRAHPRFQKVLEQEDRRVGRTTRPS